MLRSVLLLLFALPALPAQDPALRVEVPTFANKSCPIMGKKVSMPLFVDTVLGRIYVCCKPCFKKILADVDTAHQTAYPQVEEVDNATCPVSGRPIGDEPVVVTLQSHRFRVCSSRCADEARVHSQRTLIALTRPHVLDTGNQTCPVSGDPVAANAVVVIGDRLVHLASPRLLEQVEAAPDKVLADAIQIAARQRPAPRPAPEPQPKTERRRDP